MDNVILTVAGIDYSGGWESVTITRAVDEAASSFTLQIADPDYNNADVLEVVPGDAVSVSYGKDKLVTGYIDSVTHNYDATSHYVTIDGRSKTKDLIDCSALENTQFKGQNIAQIAEKLSQPYGVKVVVGKADLKPIPNFQIKQDGESVYSAVERLANAEGLNITDTVDGHLKLTNLGDSRSENSLIIDGKGLNSNIKSCSAKFGETGRYSKVVVKAQRRSNDTDFGKSTAQVIGEAVDPEVKRPLVKTIRASTEMTTEQAAKKAAWVLQEGAGKGTELSYIVQGWRGNAGRIWRDNQLVTVTDSLIGVSKKEFLISRVEYNISNEGTTCTLTLNPPDTYIKELKNEHNKPRRKRGR